MKIQSKPILTALLGGALFAGASLAQEGDRPSPPPPGGPQGRGNPVEMIKRADSDGDGKISKEEFVNARRAEQEEAFARLDANSDGYLDEAELKTLAERMRGGFGRGPEGMRRPEGEGGFRRPDGGRPEGEPGFRRPPEEGREGRPEEARRPEGEGGFRRPEGGPPPGGERPGFLGEQAFTRMDQNGDGVLSKEEFDQGMARLREAMRGGMGRGERPPGGFRRPGGPDGEGGGFRRPPQQGGEGTGRARPPLEGEAAKKDEA